MVSGPRRPSLADQVTAGAELAVLADGPWAHRWYWVADLEAMRHSARRYPSTHPAGIFQNYQATTDRAAHPDDPELTGRVYRYSPPAPETQR